MKKPPSTIPNSAKEIHARISNGSHELILIDKAIDDAESRDRNAKHSITTQNKIIFLKKLKENHYKYVSKEKLIEIDNGITRINLRPFNNDNSDANSIISKLKEDRVYLHHEHLSKQSSSSLQDLQTNSKTIIAIQDDIKKQKSLPDIYIDLKISRTSVGNGTSKKQPLPPPHINSTPTPDPPRNFDPTKAWQLLTTRLSTEYTKLNNVLREEFEKIPTNIQNCFREFNITAEAVEAEEAQKQDHKRQKSTGSQIPLETKVARFRADSKQDKTKINYKENAARIILRANLFDFSNTIPYRKTNDNKNHFDKIYECVTTYCNNHKIRKLKILDNLILSTSKETFSHGTHKYDEIEKIKLLLTLRNDYSEESIDDKDKKDGLLYLLDNLRYNLIQRVQYKDSSRQYNKNFLTPQERIIKDFSFSNIATQKKISQTPDTENMFNLSHTYQDAKNKIDEKIKRKDQARSQSRSRIDYSPPLKGSQNALSTKMLGMEVRAKIHNAKVTANSCAERIVGRIKNVTDTLIR